MANPTTGPDQIRLQQSGADIPPLNVIGTVPGIRILEAAGLNGPGRGMVRTTGAGQTAQWKAPGSSSWGTAVSIAADQEYLLQDGTDPDKYIRIDVKTAFLEAGQTSDVWLEDLYNNGTGGADIPDGQSTDGPNVLAIKNLSSTDTVQAGARVWLEPGTTFVEISLDGSAWSSPTTEGTGLTFGPLAAGAEQALHVRKNHGGTTSPYPAALVPLKLSFTGSAKHYHDSRGLYRIFQKATYRLHWRNDRPPLESDTPQAETDTMPFSTPSGSILDGTWYFSMSYFNGVLDSGFLPLGPNGRTYRILQITGGASVGLPPQGPNDWILIERPQWQVRIQAFIVLTGQAEDPTEWAIASDIGLIGLPPADPDPDTPNETVPIAGGGLAVLTHDIMVGADSIIKVRLQTRRNDGTEQAPNWIYSTDSYVLEYTLDSSQLPAAPEGGTIWRKPLGEGLSWQ